MQKYENIHYKPKSSMFKLIILNGLLLNIDFNYMFYK